MTGISRLLVNSSLQIEKEEKQKKSPKSINAKLCRSKGKITKLWSLSLKPLNATGSNLGFVSLSVRFCPWILVNAIRKTISEQTPWSVRQMSQLAAERRNERTQPYCQEMTSILPKPCDSKNAKLGSSFLARYIYRAFWMISCSSFSRTTLPSPV